MSRDNVVYDKNATIPPINHAGHQTHHTTTCVQSPVACHPKAASASMAPSSTPHIQHRIHITIAGDPSPRNILIAIFDAMDPLDVLEEPRDKGVAKVGPMKDNGAVMRPMRNEREKLRVASVAKNIPKRRSEKHCMRRICWGDGETYRKPRANSWGTKKLTIAKT